MASLDGCSSSNSYGARLLGPGGDIAFSASPAYRTFFGNRKFGKCEGGWIYIYICMSKRLTIVNKDTCGLVFGVARKHATSGTCVGARG